MPHHIVAGCDGTAYKSEVSTQRVAGRYTILREIGRGGMGTVFLAKEDGRERPIALKVLSTREYSDSALRDASQRCNMRRTGL